MLTSDVDPHTLPCRVLLPREILEGALSRISPGVRAMTDFSAETPVCVFPGRHVDDALQNPLCESHPCRHQDVRVSDIMTP
jgi:hypothetical protein